MKKFKQVLILFLVGLLIAAGLVFAGCSKKKTEKKKEKKVEKKAPPTEMILATTTSTKDTGLLDEIIPDFEKKYNVTVKTIAVGTGEALAMGQKGEADVLLVHARKSEDEFMAGGFGSVRKDVMQNDFVLLGPEDDPAGIKGSTTAADAFKKIAGAKAVFITRGDDSGTHKKELKIWEAAGITPSGDWYQSTGQGMGPSLQISNEKNAYILADRGTYLYQKDKIDSVILIEGGKDLLNPYGVIIVNPEKFSKVHKKEAEEFVGWITSYKVQKQIGEFGKDKYGQALFTPESEQWKAKQQ